MTILNAIAVIVLIVGINVLALTLINIRKRAKR